MWMRKGRIRSVYVMCFAALMMVAQLAVTSGHVHLAALHSGSDDPGAAPASGAGNNGPAVPAHHGHDFCPLCWAQAAAGGLLLPGAAELCPPGPIDRSEPIVSAGHIAGLAPSASFNPRAPPHSAGA